MIISEPRSAVVPNESPVRAADAPHADLAHASPGRRNNHFNLIRLTLAALVMLSHSPTMIDGDRHREVLFRIFHANTIGALAVDGFFLLSGFLIVQSWVRDPNLLRFLKKRVLRIYPAFIVASLISALLVGWLGTTTPHFFHEFRYGKFFTGMLLLKPPNVPSAFVDTFDPVVNGAMWTIKYEFQCYLIVAGLGLCGIFAKPKWWLAFAIGMMGVFIFLTAVQNRVVFGHEFEEFSRPGLISFLMFFTAGGCFYLYKDKIPYRPTWVLLATVIFIACLFGRTAGLLALPTVGAYVFFWLAFLHLPMRSPIKVHADISYGLYLYGWPTQKLLLWYVPTLSPWALFPISLVIAAAAGWVSWVVVEAPFMRLKPQTSRPAA